MQGRLSEQDEHGENMHFGTLPIHYTGFPLGAGVSGKHRKLTVGDDG